MNDPTDVDCPSCTATSGDPCVDENGDRVPPHDERVEHAESAWGSDLGHGVLDLDGDGVPSALDFDDPGNWW